MAKKRELEEVSEREIREIDRFKFRNLRLRQVLETIASGPEPESARLAAAAIKEDQEKYR